MHPALSLSFTPSQPPGATRPLDKIWGNPRIAHQGLSVGIAPTLLSFAGEGMITKQSIFYPMYDTKRKKKCWNPPNLVICEYLDTSISNDKMHVEFFVIINSFVWSAKTLDSRFCAYLDNQYVNTLRFLQQVLLRLVFKLKRKISPRLEMSYYWLELHEYYKRGLRILRLMSTCHPIAHIHSTAKCILPILSP